MNMEEAFKLLSLKDEGLRKLYFDLLEENVKLKKEIRNLLETSTQTKTKRHNSNHN